VEEGGAEEGDEEEDEDELTQIDQDIFMTARTLKVSLGISSTATPKINSSIKCMSRVLYLLSQTLHACVTSLSRAVFQFLKTKGIWVCCLYVPNCRDMNKKRPPYPPPPVHTPGSTSPSRSSARPRSGSCSA
jgi:hypothetical protein